MLLPLMMSMFFLFASLVMAFIPFGEKNKFYNNPGKVIDFRTEFVGIHNTSASTAHNRSPITRRPSIIDSQ